MLNRRTLLRSTLGLGAAGLVSPLRLPAFAQDATPLAATTRTIDVDGRAATVFGLLRPDGGHGLTLDAGGRFAVTLENRCGEPTLIHWHGLTPPWDQDGGPDTPKPLLSPGETRAYDFPVGEGGTFWMHAHTLQEQRLLAAPLIVRRAVDRAADEQEVVVLLHDFSFSSPEDLLADLRKPSADGGHAMHAMPGMPTGGAMPGMMNLGSMPMAGHDMKGMMDHGSTPMAGMKHDMGGMPGMAMDLNDIDYDAYLANDRTLSDPEVVRVEKGGKVRLRIIDAAASTAFVIDTGALEAALIEVDGQPVVPVTGRRFGMTMGQRIDLRVTLPKEGGAFPILALREGAVERTGVVLATAGATVAKVAGVGSTKAPALDLRLERSLRAVAPLAPKAPDRTHVVDLTGDMAGYSWAMSAESFPVKRGERVEITLRNHSMMSHPMHLHGHHFQVVAIDGERFAGAMRDTVLAPPMRTVTIAFDAQNLGKWAFHCHHLYHMATGMMAFLAYEGV
ncbi:MAG: multicopper oxidase domain-containing protein [Hyphomicrobiales bacterium]|nr:multicopper oxidase domain-containing protein [Hyphomicrobiales bacterium]